MRFRKSSVKRAIIKEVIRSLKVELLLLQEAKLSLMPQMAVRELWGNSHCSWASLDAHGSSGGILLCWNSRKYTMIDQYIGASSVSAVLEDKASGSTWIISSAYGPTDRRLHGSFWCELDLICNKWAGPWCLGGD